jgi:hypothetical protein
MATTDEEKEAEIAGYAEEYTEYRILVCEMIRIKFKDHLAEYTDDQIFRAFLKWGGEQNPAKPHNDWALCDYLAKERFKV